MSESKVVDMQAAREARKPHASGMCHCLDCKHEWACVAPATSDGVQLFHECPNCGRKTGRWSNWFAWDDHYYWHCFCGNDLLRIYRGEDGQPVAFCVNCASMRNVASLEES